MTRIRTVLAWTGLFVSLLASPAQVSAQDAPPDCANAIGQSDMTICASIDLEAAEVELNAELKATEDYLAELDDHFKTIDPAMVGGVEALKKSHQAWLEHRDNDCVVASFDSHGGSIEPMLIDRCRERMTRERTKALKVIFEGPE